MKRPTIVYLIACLWCWATLIPLRGIPLWVHLSGGGAPTGGVQSPTGTDIAVWWAFSDLTDASGNGRAITGVGTESHVAGNVSNCIRFDANGEYGRIDNAPWQKPTGSFTMGGWFRTSDASPSTDKQFFSKTDFSTQRCYNLELNSDETISVSVSGDGLTNGGAITSTRTFDDNDWIFVVVVFTASSKLELYIDGTLEGTDSTDIPTQCFQTSSAPINIWNYNNSSLTWADVRDADEVFIANRAFTAGEIEWLHNSGAGKTYSDL